MTSRRVANTFAVLVLSSIVSAPVNGQASLLQDIRTTPNSPSTESSNPQCLVEYDGLTYFIAEHWTGGGDLWRTDGTAEGTEFFFDVRPGTDGAFWTEGPLWASGCHSPGIVANGLLYFQTWDPPSAPAVWRTDGTAQGTFPLAEVVIGNNEDIPIAAAGDGNGAYFMSDISDGLWFTDGTIAGTQVLAPLFFKSNHMVPLDGTLIFYGLDVGGAPTLWKTDSTPGGTVLLAQMGAAYLTRYNGEVFFEGDDGGGDGQELWKTDGTVSGTQLVKDIQVGPGNSTPWNLVAHSGLLFFRANDGVSGGELWKTDGTTLGTERVKDIQVGPGSSSPQDLFISGGVLYFTADDGISGRELWTTDGTDIGTVLVKDIYPGANASSPLGFTDVDGRLSFIADDGASGRELWRSDGTPGGTALVADITTGPGNPNITVWTVLEDMLFFGANDGVVGKEPWVSDGFSAGTTLIKDIHPTTWSDPSDLSTSSSGLVLFGAGDDVDRELWVTSGVGASKIALRDPAADSLPSDLTLVGNEVLFAATDDTRGFELWKTDGTPGGTTLVKDVWSGATDGLVAGTLDTHDGVLYFCGNGGSGVDLWHSDGSDPGTARLVDLAPGQCPDPEVRFDLGGTLHFLAEDQLWQTDGTTVGTVAVAPSGTAASEVFELGALAFFASDNGVNGAELWRTDGTAGGTFMVQDIHAGGDAIGAPAFADFLGSLFFAATDGPDNTEPWLSDGSAGGAALIKNINPGGSSNPEPLAVLNGELFFAADDGTNGIELWKTDGSNGGTTLVLDIRSGSGDSGPAEGVVVGNLLYFTADDGAAGRELWRSDGTAPGTYLVKDTSFGYYGGPEYLAPAPHGLVEIGGRLLFFATDLASGSELWVSDGTTEGTTVLREIAPGSMDIYSARQPYSHPNTLTRLGDRLYFIASDGVGGLNPWVTDGTYAGTGRLADVIPGAVSLGLDPETVQYTLLGDQLVFRARGPVVGDELWAISAGTPGTVPDGSGAAPLTALRLGNGDVTLDWAAPSCGNTLDYEVYSGSVGDFSSHAPVLCTTGAATTATITPGGGSEYFLVVPRSEGLEGSYGKSGDGSERPVSPSSCLAQVAIPECS